MSNLEKISKYFSVMNRRNSYPTPPDDQKIVDKVKRPRAVSNDKQKISGFCENYCSKTVQVSPGE
jgi:hypothetical protein